MYILEFEKTETGTAVRLFKGHNPQKSSLAADRFFNSDPPGLQMTERFAYISLPEIDPAGEREHPRISTAENNQG